MITRTCTCVCVGCALLGDYLQLIKKDFKKAAKAYKYGCEEYDYWKCKF